MSTISIKKTTSICTEFFNCFLARNGTNWNDLLGTFYSSCMNRAIEGLGYTFG